VFWTPPTRPALIPGSQLRPFVKTVEKVGYGYTVVSLKFVVARL